MLELALIAWAALVAIHILRLGKRGIPSVGLPLTYVLGLTMVFWFGALIHTFPWHVTTFNDFVEDGFIVSTVGLASFTVGSMLVGPQLAVSLMEKIVSRRRFAISDSRLPAYYFVVGLVLVGVVFPLLGDLPTVTALSFSGAYIVIWAVCLGHWRLRVDEGSLAWWKVMIWAIVLPIMTAVLMENVVRAIMGIIMIVTFLVVSFRRRAWVLAAGIAVFYLGMSLGIGYLATREEMRVDVRYGSFVDKTERVLKRLGAIELFDPMNDEHLQMIDLRMNHNILVGAAYFQLESKAVDYANGETIWYAVLAMVPRIIWPDKPVAAGSMNLAGIYTGFEFAEGTSVGLGPILEFFINFGMLGVIVGMAAIGTLLRIIDAFAATYLHQGDWMRAATLFVAGIGMIQVEGSFVEVTASCLAAFFATVAANRVYLALPISRAAMSRRLLTPALGAHGSA